MLIARNFENSQHYFTPLDRKQLRPGSAWAQVHIPFRVVETLVTGFAMFAPVFLVGVSTSAVHVIIPHMPSEIWL